MTLECTAVYKRVPTGYVAFVEELPGANTQGATPSELILDKSLTLASD